MIHIENKLARHAAAHVQLLNVAIFDDHCGFSRPHEFCYSLKLATAQNGSRWSEYTLY
jgi:hypothetical protein